MSIPCTGRPPVAVGAQETRHGRADGAVCHSLRSLQSCHNDYCAVRVAPLSLQVSALELWGQWPWWAAWLRWWLRAGGGGSARPRGCPRRRGACWSASFGAPARPGRPGVLPAGRASRHCRWAGGACRGGRAQLGGDALLASPVLRMLWYHGALKVLLTEPQQLSHIPTQPRRLCHWRCCCCISSSSLLPLPLRLCGCAGGA